MPATVYILLFRGVGGATQLPVKPLREKLAGAGFDRVATYINSGNAIVRSDLSRDEVVAEVARICREHFGFEKAIFAPTLQEWKALIVRNPFPEGAESGKFLHAAWLEKAPAQENIERLQQIAASDGMDGFAVVGRVAYLHTPHGFGVSKLAEKFDKVIGVANTARNWNTVRKLAELAEAAEQG
ncbi:MAG TPA: DUF1697 domain-containing protein [Bacteroidia bacterium]|nr:DUF1697 domain-containing protein [Bacteroidia bacterium]